MNLTEKEIELCVKLNETTTLKLLSEFLVPVYLVDRKHKQIAFIFDFGKYTISSDEEPLFAIQIKDIERLNSNQLSDLIRVLCRVTLKGLSTYIDKVLHHLPASGETIADVYTEYTDQYNDKNTTPGGGRPGVDP